MVSNPPSTRPAERSNRLFALVLIAIALITGWQIWRKFGAAEGAGGGDSGQALEEHHPRIHGKETIRGGPKLETLARASLGGVVTDEHGAPVAQATVCVRAGRSQLLGIPAGDPICATTAADGRYRIDDLLPVRSTVDASAREHVPAQWSERVGTRWNTLIALDSGAHRGDVDLILRSGGVRLTGVVSDLSGGEIEGAIVLAHGPWAGERPTGQAIVVTDAAGRFEAWVAPGDASVEARAEGYANGTARSAAPSDLVVVHLTPESVLVGRIVDAQTGEPMSEMIVEPGKGDRMFFGRPREFARSDERGEFRIGRLSPGAYKVIASDDEHYGESEQLVHLGLAQTSSPIEVRVHKVASVSGEIVEAQSETPCASGIVSLTSQVGGGTKYAATEADGRLIIRGVDPGAYSVAVRCDGYIADEVGDLDVGETAIADQRWTVRMGLAIRGIVVDGGGTPVPDISVAASQKLDEGDPRARLNDSWGGNSDAEGRFELAGLEAGTYALRTFGQRPTPLDPIEVEIVAGKDREDVRIELPASGTIRGRVVDARGAAQPGVTVSAEAIGGMSWGRSGRTRDDGTFELEHIQTGSVRVRVSDEGFWGDDVRIAGTSDEDLPGEVVAVTDGETTQVELKVETRAGTIRGKVLDADGQALDDAFIRVVRMSESGAASRMSAVRLARWDLGGKPILSDAEGRFEVTGLPEGKYVVRADRRGGGEAIAEDVAVGSTVELRIQPTSTLSGKVVVEGGKPPARFTIRAHDREKGESRSDSFFRTGGTWSLSQLQAGTYEVLLESPEGSARLEGIEVTAGQDVSGLELGLEMKVTIRGRLVDLETRDPLPGFRVSASMLGGQSSVTFFDGGQAARKDVSDAEGVFEVENVPVGKIRLSVFPRDFGTDSNYGFEPIHATTTAREGVQDIGDVKLTKMRAKFSATGGDLGLEIKELDGVIEPEDALHVVGVVRRGGPAAAAGVRVGDVIVSVDGHSVRGLEAGRYYPLTHVEEGAVLQLGIERDAKPLSITLTAGPPVQ